MLIIVVYIVIFNVNRFVIITIYILFSAVIVSFYETISNDLSKYPLRDAEFITKTRILDLSDEERKIINLK